MFLVAGSQRIALRSNYEHARNPDLFYDGAQNKLLGEKRGIIVFHQKLIRYIR